MSIARSALLKAAQSQWLADQMSRRSFAKRAIRKFMPGEELEDCLAACRQLADRGRGAIVTQLGENLTSLADATAVRDHYLQLLGTIQTRALPAAPSVKPSQLGLDLSFDTCLEYLNVLADRAQTANTMLWIDMEDSKYVDRTIDLFRKVRAKHERIGLAIQAYLRRTPADLQSLLPLKPTIRLVKGAYAEPADLAFPEKRDTDEAFYQLSRTMLAATKDGARLIAGTHDMTLIRRMAAAAEELGVKKDQWEVHMLYGIRTAEQEALHAEGRVVRTLISYGKHWFKWYMRRLAERPANVWFVVKSMVA